jgi:hypothetical protein
VRARVPRPERRRARSFVRIFLAFLVSLHEAQPRIALLDLQAVIAMQFIRRLRHSAIWSHQGPQLGRHGVRFSQILLGEPRPNGRLQDMRNIGKNAQHHDTEVMA